MIDKESRFLAQNYQDLADAGLLALMMLREFDGSGWRNWGSQRAPIIAC